MKYYQSKSMMKANWKEMAVTASVVVMMMSCIALVKIDSYIKSLEREIDKSEERKWLCSREG